MFGVALRKKRDDVAGTQTSPDCLGVVTVVAQYAVRTMPLASPLSLQGWDCINQCEGLLRVVMISPGELDGQRYSPSVADQMTFAAQLGSVGWSTVERYPDENAARRSVVGLVLEINTDARSTNSGAMTVAQLCDLFRATRTREGKHLAQSRYQDSLQSVLEPLDSSPLAEIRPCRGANHTS